MHERDKKWQQEKENELKAMDHLFIFQEKWSAKYQTIFHLQGANDNANHEAIEFFFRFVVVTLLVWVDDGTCDWLFGWKSSNSKFILIFVSVCGMVLVYF